MEKEWYEQAILQGCTVYDVKEQSFIIYKGFKITKTESLYTVLDVRKSDMYSKITGDDLRIISELGFIKGVDKISYERNKTRVDFLEKTIRKLNEEKDKASSKLQDNVKFYTKKLKNIEVNKVDTEDLLIFYKSKIKQYEDKNNINK